MANITIKTNYDTVSIVFGNFATAVNVTRSEWRKDALISVFQQPNGVVVIRTIYKQDYPFSVDGVASSLVVDSVDGVAPTDSNHLYDMVSGVVN